MLSAVARLLSGAAVAQIGGMLAAVGIAAALGPRGFGAFVVLATLLLASSHLHLGLKTAMEKQVPLVAAQGDHAKGRALVESAWAGHLRLALAAGLLSGLAGALSLALGGDRQVGVALLCGLAAVPARATLEHRLALARIKRQAGRSSRLVSIASLAPMGGGLVGALATHRADLSCLAATLGVALAAVASRGAPGERLRPRWHADAGSLLWRLGLPLYLTVILDVSLRLVDRGLVGLVLGSEALGQYGVAVTAGWAPSLLAFAVGFVQLPLLLRALGKGHDPTALVDTTGQRLGLAALVVCLLAALPGPPLLRAALPAYGPASTCFAAFLPGVLAWTLARTPVHLLVAHDDLRPLVLAQVAMLGGNLLLDGLALELGLGLQGVAWATSLSLVLGCGWIVSLALGRHLPHVRGRYLSRAGAMVLVVVIASAVGGG